MCGNPKEFIPTSPVLPPDFWDGKKLTVHLLFCRVLLPGFVPNRRFLFSQQPLNSSLCFSMCMLILFSVDEKLLPKCVKWSPNFRSFLFNGTILFKTSKWIFLLNRKSYLKPYNCEWIICIKNSDLKL